MATEKKPAVQGEQTLDADAPVAAEYVPAAHAVQVDTPVAAV